VPLAAVVSVAFATTE